MRRGGGGGDTDGVVWVEESWGAGWGCRAAWRVSSGGWLRAEETGLWPGRWGLRGWGFRARARVRQGREAAGVADRVAGGADGAVLGAGSAAAFTLVMPGCGGAAD